MKGFATTLVSLVISLVFSMGTNAVIVESNAAVVKPVVAAANTTDLATASPAPVESSLVGNDAALEVSPCYWDGVAPFCNGACPYGYVDCGRDYCGDGFCCVTGIKVWCCREGSGECD
ncbi:hypothetical protein GY45DRAFT_454758 [Cubamyces sp. BRFM 1775]|nr:hypothetical protein GY45DRAFT_454758 [Cubamyces sp. BRFM 1775]